MYASSKLVSFQGIRCSAQGSVHGALMAWRRPPHTALASGAPPPDGTQSASYCDSHSDRRARTTRTRILLPKYILQLATMLSTFDCCTLPGQVYCARACAAAHARGPSRVATHNAQHTTHNV